MKKLILSYLLLNFLSPNVIAGGFNQQIEEFDNYINNSHGLKWEPDSIVSNSERPQNIENTYSWRSLPSNKEKGSFLYKVINKGQNIFHIEKKTITFKVELVNYEDNGNLSAINVNAKNIFSIPFNALPDDYKKLITIIGNEGSGIVYSSNSPPKANVKIKCYSIEVLSAL